MLFDINIKNIKIPSYPSIYENVNKYFWLGFFGYFFFRIKFKISVLDLKLLPKTVFHLEGLNYSTSRRVWGKEYTTRLVKVSKGAVVSQRV